MDVLHIDAPRSRRANSCRDEEDRDWSDAALDLRAGSAGVTIRRAPAFYPDGMVP